METLKIRVEGEFDGRKVSLSNVPLAAMTTSFEALKKLLARTSNMADQTSVSLVEGSVCVEAHLPTDAAVVLGRSTRERTLSESDPYAEFVRTLERAASQSGLTYSVYEDQSELTRITPERGASLTITQRKWIHTSMMIYGFLFNMGGKNPNIHVETEEYGRVRIDIDQRSIRSLQLYQYYNFEVEGPILLENPPQLGALKFVRAIRASGETSLEEAIAIEGPKWAGGDSMKWLEELRRGAE
ncbi:hypothetical protein DEIGR_100510 [Deinococcus grandis]|uniref:Uncharacterized protein n=1 Tax=Deinococcus grandis TaxID=57498 RepID=A0A100HH29_9DEIO|nr:hypothetical protein [Deinococcus grandis]BBN96035.1 hypothetical protein DEGR_27680 [Deinococcus grandis]GAQ20483.1 hypothetical protein DEIGR_100510 [Deinococcus grandis]